jgi:hypothetical protein
MKLDQKYIDRFHSRYTRAGDDECWPWKAGRATAGYGRHRPTARVYIRDDASAPSTTPAATAQGAQVRHR